MEVLAVSTFIFVFVNICLGIGGFIDLISSNRLNNAVRTSRVETKPVELMLTLKIYLTVIAGEVISITVCVLLFAWYAYRLSPGQKVQEINVKYIIPGQEENSNMTTTHAKDLVNVLEDYKADFQKLLKLNEELSSDRSEWNSATVFEELKYAELHVSNRQASKLLETKEDGTQTEVDSLQQWTVNTEEFPHTKENTDTSLTKSVIRSIRIRSPNQFRVKILHSATSRRWAASYARAFWLMGIITGLLLSTTIPYYLLYLALSVLQQTLAFNLIQLAQSAPAGATLNGTDYWRAFEKGLNCYVPLNVTGCFATESEDFDDLSVLSKCTEQIRSPIYLTRNEKQNVTIQNNCAWAFDRWIGARKQFVICRLVCLWLAYAVSSSLIIPLIVANSTSTECQTSSRLEWWRGSANRTRNRRYVGRGRTKKLGKDSKSTEEQVGDTIVRPRDGIASGTIFKQTVENFVAK
ncbi:unnamed protein product [Calicophoron daubneyi]|uniref:Uncharacterized protein n=1 Tax=Calicophoron daubneyi TaxID=300641 RepID=A0AAV2TJG5_CALDB